MLIVKNKAALVRAGPSFSSDVVGELPKGTLITCGDSAFHDGVASREVLAPLKGWASAKCLADAPIDLPPPAAGRRSGSRRRGSGPSPDVHHGSWGEPGLVETRLCADGL